jgi:carbon monoxide dehydrogenase subunit G
VKIQGSHVLPATREQVWEFLNDPMRLAKCLPGCEKLEPFGPDRYKVAVKYAIAAVGGNFSGTIELLDKKPPKSMRLRTESKGAPGFVKGEGALELTEKGKQTELRYSGEAQVGGLIAAVGQRMIDMASKKIIQQFFESVASQLKAAGK